LDSSEPDPSQGRGTDTLDGNGSMLPAEKGTVVIILWRQDRSSEACGSAPPALESRRLMQATVPTDMPMRLRLRL
jgi:hypothetical protein